MTTRTKKKFDCVETVRKERTKIARETEGMSPEEILEYFREKKGNK
jgi:hypothetical protein